MTVEELSELYYINKEIEQIQKELYDLKNKNFFKNTILSDMPKGGERLDEFVAYVDDVRTLENMLQYSLRKLQEKRKKIEAFLEGIEDSELRLIMRLRAVNNMKWEEIAGEIGLERTTVSKKFYKYFRQLKIPTNPVW